MTFLTSVGIGTAVWWWYTQDVTRLTKLPPSSLLASRKDAHYSDGFELEVHVPATNSPRDEAELKRQTTRFARAFFTSPIFFPERVLLRLMYGPIPEAELSASNAFDEGDGVSCFRVVQRANSEVLLETSMRTCTWLSIEAPSPESDGRRLKLRMGSALLGPAPSSEWHLVTRLTIALHAMYSQALLAGAASQFVRLARRL